MYYYVVYYQATYYLPRHLVLVVSHYSHQGEPRRVCLLLLGWGKSPLTLCYTRHGFLVKRNTGCTSIGTDSKGRIKNI